MIARLVNVIYWACTIVAGAIVACLAVAIAEIAHNGGQIHRDIDAFVPAIMVVLTAVGIWSFGYLTRYIVLGTTDRSPILVAWNVAGAAAIAGAWLAYGSDAATFVAVGLVAVGGAYQRGG
jgi:hypothetical protein